MKRVEWLWRDARGAVVQFGVAAVLLYLWQRVGSGPSLQTVVFCLLGASTVAGLGILARREFLSTSPSALTKQDLVDAVQALVGKPVPQLAEQPRETPVPEKPLVLRASAARVPFPWSVITEPIAPKPLATERPLLSWPGWLVFTLKSNRPTVVSGARLRIKGAKVVALARTDHPSFNFVTGLTPLDAAQWDDLTIELGDLAPGGTINRAMLVDMSGASASGPKGFLWWLENDSGELDSGNLMSIT